MSAQDVDRPIAPATKQLTRPADDRMIAGVASGLARYLDVDPVIIRLVFVVLALAGGGGVLAYLVAWIVIPSEAADGQPPPTEARSGSGASAVAGLVLVTLGGLLLAARLIPAFSWRYAGPVLLIALGVLLLARRTESS